MANSPVGDRVHARTANAKHATDRGLANKPRVQTHNIIGAPGNLYSISPAPLRAITNEGTHHRFPDDRIAWHLPVNRPGNEGLSVAPPWALPGRRQVAHFPAVSIGAARRLPDLLRPRLRLWWCRGALGREANRRCLGKGHPPRARDSRERLRTVLESSRPTCGRGAPRWTRAPEAETVRSLMVPAADGCTVDKVSGICVAFDAKGRLI